MINKLRKSISELKRRFLEISSKFSILSNQSQSSYSTMYLELAENYSEGSTVCNEYLKKNIDIVQFVKKMVDLEHPLEILLIKNLIQDPLALRIVEEIERDFKSVVDNEMSDSD
jgi:hypothetical protein